MNGGSVKEIASVAIPEESANHVAVLILAGCAHGWQTYLAESTAGVDVCLVRGDCAVVAQCGADGTVSARADWRPSVELTDTDAVVRVLEVGC